MIKKLEYACVFLSGGIIYSVLEIIWRGYTHWSMTCAGGICFLLIYFTDMLLTEKSVFLRSLVDCGLITAVEFFTGVVVNLRLRLDVWDYSAMPGNIAGQICPLFTLLWFFLSIPACLLSEHIRRFFDIVSERDKNEKDEKKQTIQQKEGL